MAEPLAAIDFVLSNEGGFVDNPNDSGGATNFGLSLRFLREIPNDRLRKYGIFKNGDELGVEDIRDLTLDQARLIYKGEFWDSAPFDKINDQLIATYLFDMAVLHGIAQAIKIAQRGSWAVYRTYGYIKADGIMGEKTQEVLNDLGDSFIPVLMAMRASFCRLLAELRPKDKEFLDGWLKRCYRI
jgi:lysozyme family protein